MYSRKALTPAGQIDGMSQAYCAAETEPTSHASLCRVKSSTNS
jgi:hypothetical protein